VTAEPILASFVLVTADNRDRVGMGGDLRRAAPATLWVPEIRLWVLSCKFV
jgi:hypothetical protein